MAKTLNRTTRHKEAPAYSNVLGWLRAQLRRPGRLRGISHLDERMLRDIGLCEGRRSELRKIERLRRP